MAKRVTKARLLADLRRLLRRPDTKVLARKLKICGHSTWCVHEMNGIQDITIVFDPRRDGRVRVVIHELIHIWLGYMHLTHEGWSYEMEESVVLALESKLYAWLHDPKRSKELESWDKAIERKMR